MGHIIAKVLLLIKNFSTVNGNEPFTIQMKVNNMQVRNSM